jgi:hypothetical protein
MATYWQTLLPEMPQAEYFGTLAGKNFTPAQSNYFGNQYGDIYNKYLGQLGRTTMLGGTPNMTFQQFLAQYPWLRTFNALSPYQRGVYSANYNPALRWLVYQ